VTLPVRRLVNPAPLTESSSVRPINPGSTDSGTDAADMGGIISGVNYGLLFSPGGTTNEIRRDPQRTL